MTSTERYHVQVPLRWSDMDAYGHVNNVQFLRLLEDARVTGFRDWFGQDRSLLDEGVLVTGHEIEYRAPLRFRHEPVLVSMWCSAIGGASFDLSYVMTDPPLEGGTVPADHSDPGAPHATVYAVALTGLVAYDFAAAAPRRLRPDERATLTRHHGDAPTLRRRR